MNRGLVCALALACAVLSAETPAHSNDYSIPPPGYQPDLTSDEAGLWMEVDKAEAEIKSSPALIRDPALNAYVDGVVCKLAGPRCGSIRVYILDVPYFNAMMMPNGTMIVWSGLLFRVENEAQLAFVLGHEITHYLDRHTLRHYESAVATSNVMAFLSIATAGVGMGFIGSLATLAATSALYANSRDQEREADAGGFDMGTANGYDPREAPKIWRFVVDEEKSNPHRHGEDIFTATHPTPDERLETLSKQADKIFPQRNDWTVNADTYRVATKSFRVQWIGDELNRGESDESIVLFTRLIASDQASGPLYTALGDAYRKRNGKDDADKAIAAYQDAVHCADTPPQVYRGMGLIAMKAGKNDEARGDFTQYLALAPSADDRAMIDYYISKL